MYVVLKIQKREQPKGCSFFFQRIYHPQGLWELEAFVYNSMDQAFYRQFGRKNCLKQRKSGVL